MEIRNLTDGNDLKAFLYYFMNDVAVEAKEYKHSLSGRLAYPFAGTIHESKNNNEEPQKQMTIKKKLIFFSVL